MRDRGLSSYGFERWRDVAAAGRRFRSCGKKASSGILDLEWSIRGEFHHVADGAGGILFENEAGAPFGNSRTSSVSPFGASSSRVDPPNLSPGKRLPWIVPCARRRVACRMTIRAMVGTDFRRRNSSLFIPSNLPPRHARGQSSQSCSMPSESLRYRRFSSVQFALSG